MHLPRRLHIALVGTLAAASWAISFVLIFKGVTLASPLALAAWQAFAGAIVLGALAVSRNGLETVRLRAAETWDSLGLAPVFALFGFYVLQVARRYTEGQSGANILFVLGLAPLVLAGVQLGRVLASRGNSSDSVSSVDVTRTLGVSVGLLGTVAIFANWERPSSFSPFAFFPAEELQLLGAGICWAVFLALLVRRAREQDPLVAGTVLLGATGFMLAVASLVAAGPSALVPSGPAFRLAVLLGAGGAALGCWSWLAMVRLEATAVEIAASVLGAPVLVSTLILLDQAQALTGPNPMVEQPVLAGSVLAVIGLGIVWTAPWWQARRELREAGAARASSRLEWLAGVLAAVFAALATAAAAAALWLPIMTSSIEGKMGDGTPFAAEWTTRGYEGAGAWLALVAAVALLLLAWRLVQGDLDGARYLGAAAVAAVLLSLAPAVADSLFVAWRGWIPAEIGHAIGTPYVDLAQRSLANPAFLAVDGLAAASFLAAIVKILWNRQKAS